MTVSYAKRRNVFDKVDWEWRIAEEGLVVRNHKGKEQLQEWDDIEGVRLWFEPMEDAAWRHQFELDFRNSQKWRIDNAHCVGVDEFTNRTDTYLPFVFEVLNVLMIKAPNVKARVGSTPTFYWVSVIGLGLLLAAAAVFLLVAPPQLMPLVLPSWLKAIIVAAMVPTLYFFASWTRPKEVALDAIPERAFPKIPVVKAPPAPAQAPAPTA